MKDKNVEIVLICEGKEEKIDIPIELFTRIDFMARSENKTFEQLFMEIIEEEVRNDEKSN